ncbi:MAG: NCS2 family permease [Leptolyngbya sp. Prado105]|jgi:AGZA family xanthine/uracil permease-like MFS transporter|nr:NCS2 family permease [Leptolyngbya sp. Prado105]
MNTQSNSTAQITPLPDDHILPDLYIDPNSCTLHDAAQQLATDRLEDEPWIVWLFEDVNSAIALPGKISLYGHDSLHAILNRGHSPADEAFVGGFTMGNTTQAKRIHQFLYKLITSQLYPKKYRLPWTVFQSFDAGFSYGRSIPLRNLHQTDFSIYQHCTVSQVRQQLGILSTLQDSMNRQASPCSKPPWLDRMSQFFRFEELGTNYQTELLAGFTIFMTTAPILVVNAHILGNAIFLQQSGDLFEQILVAIALCAAVSSFLIGLLTNYPFVLGSGTGTTALFTFSIVLGMRMNWRLALTAVLVQGILFTALSVSPLRRQLNDAIPNSLKQAMVIGLGLFLSYIALSGKVASPQVGAGIIVANTATLTSLGTLKQPATLIALFGILLTTLLTVRQVKGALLFVIFATAAIGWLTGVAPLPHGILALPQLPQDLLGQAIAGVQYLNGAQVGNFVAVVFVLLFVSLSDSMSSFNVLGQQIDCIKPNGELYRSKQSLLSNALGTAFGAIVGSTPVIPYLETASGIFEGGRSGFVAIVVGILFFISTLFTPLFAAIPAFATAPILLMIGVLMMSGVRLINWNDLAEAIPAFLVILITPLTFSIADGMAAGFIAHAVVTIAQKNRQRMRSSLVLAGIAVAYFTLITVQA